MTTPEPETYEEFMHPRGMSMRVYTETDSPMLRIETWCEHCGLMLSSTRFDATAGVAGEQAGIIGEFDAAEGLKHLEQAHGV